MTRKKVTTIEPPEPAELLVSREEAKSRLEDRIQKGKEIRDLQIRSLQEFEQAKNEFHKWDDFNEELLRRIFTTDELSKEYSYWIGGVVMSIYETSLGEKISDLHKDIDSKIHRIDSIIERLELIPLSRSTASTITSDVPMQPATKSKKAFVVHGQDEVAKTSLEVFLREIGLEPVVLHRQADQGLTIIEKFEKHSDVGYAFILLTPDEVSYLKSEQNKPDHERRKEFRARPNVIFEFGYFVGKLGRSKVCCLYTGDVSLPSDVSGMIYKKYSSSLEEIAYSIIKDLKASGFLSD